MSPTVDLTSSGASMIGARRAGPDLDPGVAAQAGIRLSARRRPAHTARLAAVRPAGRARAPAHPGRGRRTCCSATPSGSPTRRVRPGWSVTLDDRRRAAARLPARGRHPRGRRGDGTHRRVPPGASRLSYSRASVRTGFRRAGASVAAGNSQLNSPS